jgi:hypothetical protein
MSRVLYEFWAGSGKFDRCPSVGTAVRVGAADEVARAHSEDGRDEILRGTHRSGLLCGDDDRSTSAHGQGTTRARALDEFLKTNGRRSLTARMIFRRYLENTQ